MRVYFIVVVLGFCLFSCAGGPAPETPPQAVSFTGNIEEDLKAVDEIVAAGPFRAEWSSLEENGIPEWYQDAKLGIFIHWGVYAVPAFGNEWYPRNMYIDRMDQRRQVNPFQHHLKTWGPHKKFGYQGFHSDVQGGELQPR